MSGARPCGRRVGVAILLSPLLGLCAGCARHAGEATARTATLEIDCRARGHRISPSIYGIGLDVTRDPADTHQWELGATARRWGGNPASRYNWEAGAAWNAGEDWFFCNVDYSSGSGYTYRRFLDDNRRRGVASALTLPMIGWVARDTSSCSFPVEVFGAQGRVNPERPGVGDGRRRGGRLLPPGPPSRTSVPAPPESIGRWAASLREGGRPAIYVLDNEPMLWHQTHRDVHPEPMGYDELLERTLAFGGAVRAADPEAVIAGPALWGWPALFGSAKDATAGFGRAPDRKAHGDVPLLPWYLARLREHREKTGQRIVDLVDVHFYPQGEGIGHGGRGETDPDACARRIRATRALWDPAYVDESWIAEPVRLIPRLKEWIARGDPGLGIAIGEYGFGAEGHACGGLAQAEALGRFGQQGIDAAFYWTYPARATPVFWAFRAFRDFDGKGGRFLDWHLPARAPEGLSLFASTDDGGDRVVAVALNLDPSRAAGVEVALPGCGRVLEGRHHVLGGGGFEVVAAIAGPGHGPLGLALPAYSISVIELRVERPAEGEPRKPGALTPGAVPR